MLEPILFVGTSFLENLFNQVYEEEKRKQEQQLRELEIIADSSLRDQLANQLLMDKLLAPIEKAQELVQNTAKHAQYLAEVIAYYHADHGMNLDQARSICSQFRLLAIKLTESNTLHELKLVYKVITIFTDEISIFRHHKRDYSIERSVRKGILEPLNTCIASYENFQRRSELLGFEISKTLELYSSIDSVDSVGADLCRKGSN